MPLISLLFWTLSIMSSYVLVLQALYMRQLDRWTRHIAIAMAMIALTARIIRIELTDPRMHLRWDGTGALPQAVAIILTFGILADIGVPSLLIGGTVFIMMDATWIAEARGERWF